MLLGLVALLACQLAGELVVRTLDLPVPGPVLGMVLFLVVLRFRRIADRGEFTAAPALLLRHLQLFFVPAGVGIVAHLAQVRGAGLPIAVGLWLSWLVGLVVAGVVVQFLLRRKEQR